MSNEKAFDDWWNGDHLPPNQYPKDSPVFWAWAGWVMGVKAERDRCCSIVYGMAESDNVAQRTVEAIRGEP